MKLTRNFAACLIALSLGAGSATAEECVPKGDMVKKIELDAARNMNPSRVDQEAQFRIDIVASSDGGSVDNLTCEGFLALLAKMHGR
jgi:hypothetical protein